jgi:hypothetical protein
MAIIQGKAFESGAPERTQRQRLLSWVLLETEVNPVEGILFRRFLVATRGN